MSDKFSFFIPLAKIDKEKRLISGYASTPALDLDGEIVALDAVKKALPGYWAWRNIRRMHTADAVGVAKEANVDDKGLFLTAKIVDDDAWNKCVEGVYKGFSIGGRKVAKVGKTITEIELVEVSVVDRPANPECRFEIAKSAKATDLPGHLVKLAAPRDSKSKALGQMAKAVQTLAKGEDEDDSFVPIEVEGTTLPIEVSKRDVGTKERESLASQGAALPDGSFPIKTRKDLKNAIKAFGRAKDKGKTQKFIIRRARKLGAMELLPETWDTKLAKKEKKTLAESTLLRKSLASLDLKVSAPPSFLTLTSAEVESGRLDEGDLRSGHESAIEPGRLQKDGTGKVEANGINYESIINEVIAMSDGNDDLGQMLAEMLKAAKQPTRMQRMNMARGNLKKARKSMKDMEECVKAAHAMHKAAYLSKAAKKKPVPDDDGDFDHQGAMEKLQKAFNDLQSMKTFVKAAGVQLKKMAGRSGQRGQEVSDADDGFYQVPQGVKDLTPADVDTAGTGTGARGSEPPLHSLDTRFPGKAAKRFARYITPEHAEAMAKVAAAEAKVEILERLPMGGKVRPYAFDVSKLTGGNDSSKPGLPAEMFKGINPAAFQSEDEDVRKEAVGNAIGQMILGGHGKSVFDPKFHGTAGAA